MSISETPYDVTETPAVLTERTRPAASARPASARLDDDLMDAGAERDRRGRQRMYALLEQLLDERRQNLRVPMGGHARWRSGAESGDCRLLNVSPEGAAFVIPLGDVFRLGPRVCLNAELEPALEWNIAERAQIVRRTPRPDGQCEVAVVFPSVPGRVF